MKLDDKTQLRAAEMLTASQQQHKQIWYHTIEFVIAVALFSPIFQKFTNSGSSWSEFSVSQYLWICGSFALGIHAIMFVVSIVYSYWTSWSSENVYANVLTRAQERLLGVKNSSGSGGGGSPKNSKTTANQKQGFNCTLFDPKLPTIHKPLIDEKLLRTPTKPATTRTSPHATPSQAAAKSPHQQSPNNTSFLSMATLDLLETSANRSLPVVDRSAYLPEDSKISELLNNSSFHVFSEDEDQTNPNHSSPGPSPDRSGLSFYTNKSFLNSFDDRNNSYNRMNASNSSNNHPKVDDWTSGTQFQIVDKEAVKKVISEQIYRLSTPPTSPSKLMKSKDKVVDDKKKDEVKFEKYVLTDKYNKLERMKRWMNETLFSPLS